MNPLLKLHGIVLSLTTIVVYNLWGILSVTTSNSIEYKAVIAILVSLGTYQTILSVLKFSFLRIRIIKKFIFGASYLEGIWVGFFIGDLGKERFFIETYEQDFERITIRGDGYREDEGYFGSWISQNVHFDQRAGIITYQYETNAIKNSYINPGLAYFTIDRKNLTNPPYKLKGFSSDLYNPKKLKSLEKKISDIPNTKDVNDSLKIARDFYNDNKSFNNME